MKLLAIGLYGLLCIGVLSAQESLKLTKKQERFLSKQTIRTNVMGVSTFNSFASYLYAVKVAVIHTDNPLVGDVKLKSFPNPNLKVSPRELFNEIAMQTSSKWSYDKENGYWLFSRSLPYELVLATKWNQEVRDGYVFYKPQSAPVGMDIYFAGKIDSLETTSQALNRISEQFAKPIATEFTADSMYEVLLPNHNALFYKTEITGKETIWRQWAFVEDGMCFVIVSAIKFNDEATVLPDVEKMVESFKVIGVGY